MSKKHILYVGNFLSGTGKTPAPSEIISIELEKQFVVHRSSDKSNLFVRMINMLISTLKAGFRRNTTIIVDVFSTKAFWYAYLVTLLGRLMGLPVIAVLHGGNLLNRFSQSKAASRRLMTKANAIVSPSTFFVKPVQEMFKVNVNVIANPINIKEYPVLSKAYASPHLLWVRSFHVQYNPLMALDVCASLKNEYPDISLTMIGPDKDGSLQMLRNRVNELGLSDQVFTPGLMSKMNWIEESKKCNIFINTTHVDNTPVSVIEALALGFPVVSTNVGGIPFLLKHNHNALLVDDSDTKGMCSSVKKIIQQPDLRNKLVGNGRSLAEQMDIKAVGKSWNQLVHQIS